MNIEVPKMRRLYFVGIKGVAMAALAIWAKEAGKVVAGSDVGEEFPTDNELAEAGIAVHEGFDEAHLATFKPDLVIYTGAHGGRDNPVVQKARELGIPALAHGQALGMFMADYRQIVVAGSHGKTTTAAMIATVLSREGCDPSYAVGCGAIRGLGAAGHYGKSDRFVAEGDEYVTDLGHDATPRFLWQKPEILVVSNIDYDHPDVYASLTAVQEAFLALQKQQVGQRLTIVNIDDAGSSPLLDGVNVVTYGFSPRADYQITEVGFGQERTFFGLAQKGIRIGEFSLKVPGRHNVGNAVACAIACRVLGVSWEEVKSGLLSFTGTKRRFEKVGEYRGATVYDDYAHHPAEIKATLSAARRWYPKRRLVVVFQPHTYSRTKALLSDFARSFNDADTVILTDIYASAREHDTMGVRGTLLVEETGKFHPQVYYGRDFAGVMRFLDKEMKADDMIIFMGAGDIYQWGRKIVQSVKLKV